MSYQIQEFKVNENSAYLTGVDITLEENKNTNKPASCKSVIRYIEPLETKLIHIYKFDKELGNTPVGEVYYNVNSHKLITTLDGLYGTIIPFAKGAIYSYNNHLYVYDENKEELVNTGPVRLYKFDKELGNTPMGEIYYNTNQHKLIMSLDGEKGAYIPFNKNSVYIRNTHLYIYDENKEELINTNDLVDYEFAFEDDSPYYYADKVISISEGNKWVDGSNGIWVIPIPVGVKKIFGRTLSNSDKPNSICFLGDGEQVLGNVADIIGGYLSLTYSGQYVDVPEGAKYLYVLKMGMGVQNLPEIKVDVKIIEAFQNIDKRLLKINTNGQHIDNGLVELNDMPNIAVISDTFNHLSSGECNVVYEKETGLVYVTAIEGESNFYEALDNIALYVFSVTNPLKVKRFDVATKKSEYQTCYGNNVILIGYKKIRVFYSIRNEDADGGKLYYRDFDFATETFSSINNVMYSGQDLTAVLIQNITIENGYENYGSEFVYLNKITDEVNGYRYATCLCAESVSYHPLILRSSDNFMTCDVVMAFPYAVRYDCAVAALNNHLYFAHRIGGDEYASTSGTAFACYSIDEDSWICPSTKFAEGDCRPDCYSKNGKIYIFAGNNHSNPGIPERISASIWIGNGTTSFNSYAKKLIVNDSRGVQNPRLFIYGADDYGILMQNSPSRIDYENGYQGQWQYKTAICYVTTRIAY